MTAPTRSLPAVRRASPSDAEAVATIYSATLGEGYLEPAEAAREIGDRSGRHVWLVTEDAGTVVGAADALWVTRRELPGMAAPGFEEVVTWLLQESPGTQRFGLLENVGVLPGYRRRGFAAALTEARLQWLGANDVGLVYTFAWHTPEGIPALPTLERAGFRRLQELPDFYLEDGLRNGYACPWCGPECRCSALLCVREL